MFRLTDSIDRTIIGKAFPQSQHMSKDYTNYSKESIQLINFDKPIDYEPYLKSFVVENSAKLTDNVSSLAGTHGLLITEKLLNIFLSSNIQHYQYFEANVTYHKKDYKYFLFFIYGQDFGLIDYQNMKFWAMDEMSYKPNKTRRLEAKIDMPEKIINWKSIKTYPYVEYPYLEYEALKLNHSNINTDMIRLPFLLDGSYFVSEELKNKIEAAKCTGIDFRTKDWRERPIL